ncbi:vitelline membrane outer layer protein 1 homolog [Rhinoderma darwinii]|uniref:vitelline membrane outer layer protein 1 homolog n=1 Tax=Rhinoderma darwinii TaxID=43563 RepID=UPI003F66496A
MVTLVAAFVLIQATLTNSLFITVDNGGPWGDWGTVERCAPGTSARGFSLKVESFQGPLDDTALNGIKLYCCEPGSRTPINTITSTVSEWGNWTSISWCPKGNLKSFSLQVEPIRGLDDDTAANNVRMQCSDSTTLIGKGMPWGVYGGWSGVCADGSCGVKTKVEGSQGLGDDTALNDIQLECC